MPWANGKGTTIEMLRLDGPDGLLLRISRASVVENGPFSRFPGVERNLTVITGPGFSLRGAGLGRDLRCGLFEPVAFPGDVDIEAVGVTAPSDDLNVMTARALPRPEVVVVRDRVTLDAGGVLAAYAVEGARVGGLHLRRGELALGEGVVAVDPNGAVVCARIRGIGWAQVAAAIRA